MSQSAQSETYYYDYLPELPPLTDKELEQQNLELQQYWAEQEQEVLDETIALDPVAQACTYIVFISSSNGRGRNKRSPRVVEMLGYGGRYYLMKDDVYTRMKFERIAAEIYGDTVDSNDLYSLLVDAVRRLPQGRLRTRR